MMSMKRKFRQKSFYQKLFQISIHTFFLDDFKNVIEQYQFHFNPFYLIKTLQRMEQRTLRNVNNYLNTNIYSYLETSGGQSSNLYLKVVHFFNTSVN